MNEQRLEFQGDKLFLCTYGEKTCKVQLVMTKEIFQECYKRWIKPQALEQTPKTAYWEHSDREYPEYWHCSNCGAIVEKDEQHYHNWYYCYHCGAKMTESEDEK